jgi:hypothetical protein
MPSGPNRCLHREGTDSRDEAGSRVPSGACASLCLAGDPLVERLGFLDRRSEAFAFSGRTPVSALVRPFPQRGHTPREEPRVVGLQIGPQMQGMPT